MTVKTVTLFLLLFMSIVGYSQLTVGIFGEGCKFISAEGLPQGNCFSIGAEAMYSEYLGESNLGFHIRGGVKIMPLEIYSQEFFTKMRYTESIVYISLGGVSKLSESLGDELYYMLTIGGSKVSNSPYFAFKLELQGINLNKRKVWKHNLNPYVSFGTYRGWRNHESYHLQLTTGITYKL